MLITEGQILTVNSAAVQGDRLRLPARRAGRGRASRRSIFALAALLTRRTALGLLIESVGINPEASRQAGVRARGLLFAVYMFCALCAASPG